MSDSNDEEYVLGEFLGGGAIGVLPYQFEPEPRANPAQDYNPSSDSEDESSDEEEPVLPLDVAQWWVY